jgi:hypothetical protein
MASCSNGQTLQKGNFTGSYVYILNLASNVAMDQFLDVWENKVIAASLRLTK